MITPYELMKSTELYEDNISDIKCIEYDIFISAFNNEQMVKDVYSEVIAKEKYWLVLSEYKLSNENISRLKSSFYFNEPYSSSLEINCIVNMFKHFAIADINKKNICIDITGFVKPYLVFLIDYLDQEGIENITLIYSEPKEYEKKANTSFSKNILDVRRIRNFNEFYTQERKNDLTIINVGYDYKLVDKVIGDKKPNNKRILIGFPSLQASMYQENIINLKLSRNLDEGLKENEFIYAAANNPYLTAKSISESVSSYLDNINYEYVENITLIPLATKAQTLGMILFYIFEKDKYDKKNININFTYPFTEEYSSSAGKGIAKINIYNIELNLYNEII